MMGTVKKLSRWIAALAGLGLVSGAPAAAQEIPAAGAPAEWVRYATDATKAISDWLQSDSEPALRLRTYLNGMSEGPEQPSAPVVLKLWVTPDSQVTKLEFPPFAHTQPNADLRSIILGRALPGTPPRDMRLPLRISIVLEPNAADAEK